MPLSNLTPEQEHWIVKVYKHLQWQIPEHLPLDEVPESEASLTPKEECKKLGQRLSKLDKGSRAVVAKGDHLLTDEDEEAFWQVGERLFKTAQKAKKLQGKLEQEDTPDNTELKLLLTDIEHLSSEMERVARESFERADELINTTLYGQVEAFKKTIMQMKARRDPLAAWGVDLSGFDKSYEAANDTLTKMITAVNGHDYKVLKELVSKSQQKADSLEASYQKIAGEPERIKAEAVELLRWTSQEALALNDRQAELEGNPESLDLFQNLFQQFQAAEQKAQDILKATDGRALSKQLRLCKRLYYDLKQTWLKAHIHAQTSEDQTNVSKEALQQVEELTGKLELAEQQMPDVKAGCAEGAQYESTLTLCWTLLGQTQDNLIAGDFQEADKTLKTVTLNLERFDQLLAQVQENKKEVTGRLKRLTDNAETWFTRLPDCERLFEFGKDAAKYYREFDKEITILNNNITLAEKYMDTDSILLAKDAVATGEDNLKVLVSRAIAALQHVEDMDNS